MPGRLRPTCRSHRARTDAGITRLDRSNHTSHEKDWRVYSVVHSRTLNRTRQPQTWIRPNVRDGSKAALTPPKSDFRFAPGSGLNSDIARCPKGATSRHPEGWG